MNKRQPDTTDLPKVSFADDKKYTVESLAAELGKSTKTVYGWIRARKLKAYRFGKEYLITASQLNDFANDRLLKKWLAAELTHLNELDPAYVPPTEVDIDSLTEKQILSAFVIPSEWINASPQNGQEWIEMARLAGLDKSDQLD
jgi:excisionase family DNA binding protein